MWVTKLIHPKRASLKDDILNLYLIFQVRRHDSGRVMIEGCLSDDYYVIRELLYQQYAIV